MPYECDISENNCFFIVVRLRSAVTHIQTEWKPESQTIKRPFVSSFHYFSLPFVLELRKGELRRRFGNFSGAAARGRPLSDSANANENETEFSCLIEFGRTNWMHVISCSENAEERVQRARNEIKTERAQATQLQRANTGHISLSFFAQESLRAKFTGSSS